jgi:methylase of polypeptide subunit release factors
MENPLPERDRALAALGAENLAEFGGSLRRAGRGIFVPTATTGLLLRAAKSLDIAGNRVLDLGCGWGVIGLELALSRPIVLHMSDYSLAAVEAAKENSLSVGVRAEVRFGSNLEPWTEEKFNLIIADVSGVSSDAPLFDRWFDNVPAASGSTGHDLTKQILADAYHHLEDLGMVLLPLISLSNREYALELFHANFSSVSRIARIDWKLNGISEEDASALRDQKTSNNVDFEESDGVFVCWTEVYCLSAPS